MCINFKLTQNNYCELFHAPTNYTGKSVTQFAEALRYKPECHGFYSRLCHWNFSLTAFWMHYGPGVDSAPNRNEYREYFLEGKGGRCVRLTTLPTSCSDCHEISEPQPPGSLGTSPGLKQRLLYF